MIDTINYYGPWIKFLEFWDIYVPMVFKGKFFSDIYFPKQMCAKFLKETFIYELRLLKSFNTCIKS